MSDTIEVRLWGLTENVSAAMYDHLGADWLAERLTARWTGSVMRAGYVIVEDPWVQHEPRWWVRDEEGLPLLMSYGQGQPDVYEFRASGPVRERAANEPCEHGSTVEVTTLTSPRVELLCNWCSASLDGGPR